jgi:hypothetical protein
MINPQPGGFPLEREQSLFDLQPPSKPGQVPVAPDHPMTRDHDGQRIATHRPTHGPGRTRFSYLFRQTAIGNRCPVGDFLKGSPHLPLKRGPLGGESQVELPECAGEKGLKLKDRLP